MKGKGILATTFLGIFLLVQHQAIGMQAEEVEPFQPLVTSYSAVAKRAIPAVVNISSEQRALCKG